MKNDPILADVRKMRDDVSLRFNHDMRKIYSFFKEQETINDTTLKAKQGTEIKKHPTRKND